MNAQVKPSSLQQALYKFVEKQASAQDSVTFNTFTFPGTITEQHWVATTAINSDIKATLNLSLPEWSNKSFISITDQHPESFAELVASFNAESETNDALAVGYAEKLDIPALNAFGWQGIAMVKPEMVIPNFPELATVVGEDYEFILVILITAEEFKLWRKSGFEALHAKLEQKSRNLIKFDQNTQATSKQTPPHAEHRNNSFDKLTHSAKNTVKTPVGDNPMLGGPATVQSEQIKSSAPMTKPLKTTAHGMPLVQPLGITPPMSHQPVMMGFSAASATYPNMAMTRIEPLFPTPHISAHASLPADPLRINMGVEPCQEFLDGNLRELHVGNVQKVNPTSPVQAAAILASSPPTIPKPNATASSPAIITPVENTQQAAQVQAAATPVQPTSAEVSRSNARTLTPNASPTPISTVRQETPTSADQPSFKSSAKPQAVTQAKARLLGSDKPRNKIDIDFESLAFDPQELVIEEVNFVQNLKSSEAAGKKSWQIIGITALGGVLMTGGLITTIFVMDTKAPMLSALPVVFAMGGLAALVSAFKDAIAIGMKKAPNELASNGNYTL